MIIKFVTFGEPYSKCRPRFSRKGFAYTPAKTKQNEKDFLSQAIAYRPKEPLKTDLRIDLTFYMGIPLSKSKKWQERARAGQERPRKRDLDNQIKLTWDAMNTIFYADDRQIVELSARKFYSDVPRVEVEITEVIRDDTNDRDSYRRCDKNITGTG